MVTAYLAIQCTPEGYDHRGTYLHDGAGAPLSPVFRDGCIPLFDWCKANGWQPLPYDPIHPVGVFERKEEGGPRFPIGQQFTTRGKASRACTVVDILRTYNAAGDLVRIRYVATHALLGQTVTDSDVCEASIAMSLGSGRFS